MKSIKFSLSFLGLCFALFLNAKTSYYTHVNSTAGGTQGIAVRITIPDTARYSCGAPVFLFLKGGSSQTTMDLSSIKASDYGIITVDFNFPSGGSGITKSGGTYDLRGINCVTATKDVAMFAQGLIPDIDGHYLSYFTGTITPLCHNFGMLGSSEAGNIATTVAGLFPQSFPYLKWIAYWESPLGFGTAAFDPGYSDYLPTYNTGYNDTTGIFNWNNLRYDSTLVLEPATNVDGAIIGGYYFDTNQNGFHDANEYMMHGQTNKHHYFLSNQTMEHAYALNRLPTVWPSHFNTLNETHDFWFYRSGEGWIDTTFNHFPNLIVIVATTDTDHVSTAPDHPHALFQYNKALSHQLPFVRLNTDRIYAEEILKHSTTLGCDNDANIPLDHLSIRNHIQYEQLLSEVNFKVALVLESADRTQFGILDPNLNIKPGKNCINSFSVNIQVLNNTNCTTQKQLVAVPNRNSLYTYTWSPVNGLNNSHIPNPTFTDVVDRTYTVTVYNPITEQTSTASVFVSRIDAITESHTLLNGATCSLTNGAALISASTNYLPVHIVWNDFDTVFQKTNLSTGYMHYLVTDANGCQINDSIFIPLVSSCLPANITTISNYPDSSLIVNWTNSTCSNTVKLFYRIAGTSIWDSTMVVNQSSDTIKGLIPQTSYEISIATICQISPIVQSVNGNTLFASTRPHACFSPAFFTATNILQTTATINWQPNSGLLGWEIYYKPDTGTVWNFTSLNSLDSSFHLSNLTPNTSYNVKLRCQCFNNPILFSDYSFLNFQTIPYSCNSIQNLSLDSMTYNSISISWSSSSTANYYRVSYQLGSGGTWSYFNTNQTTIQINNLNPGTSYRVRVNSFCNLSNSFSNFADTLLVTTPFPACNYPLNFHVVSFGIDSVSLAWTLSSYNSSSILEYKSSAASVWQTYTINSPLHSKIVRNLLSNNSYMFRLKAYCSLGNAYSGYTDTLLVTTQNQICPVPTGLSTTNITSTKATINWNALTPSYPVKLKYTNLSNNTSSTVLCPANTNAKNLRNLLPSTNYRVILSAKCGTVFSSPSTLLYFTTLALREENPELVSIISNQPEFLLSPNPFEQTLLIHFNDFNIGKMQIEIFNTLGQIIESQNLTVESKTGDIQINSTQWPSGMYFVKIDYSGGQQSFLIIHN